MEFYLLLVAIMCIAFLSLLVFYIFGAIGIHTMAKRRGIENPWLAYIPVAQFYVIGSIFDNINAYKNKQTNYKVILLIIGLISSGSGLAGIDPVLPMIVSLGFRGLYLYCLFFIYKDYLSGNEVLFLILSTIFQIDYIFLFAIRKKVPVSMCFREEDEWQFPGNKPQLQMLWNQYYTTPQMQSWTEFLISNFRPI